jgi:hypothetical protein
VRPPFTAKLRGRWSRWAPVPSSSTATTALTLTATPGAVPFAFSRHTYAASSVLPSSLLYSPYCTQYVTHTAPVIYFCMCRKCRLPVGHRSFLCYEVCRASLTSSVPGTAANFLFPYMWLHVNGSIRFCVKPREGFEVPRVMWFHGSRSIRLGEAWGGF